MVLHILHTLELVKELVAKSQPSFLQILHIFPILDKITQPFHLFQQKVTFKKVISSLVPGIRKSPNVSTTLSLLKSE